MKREMQVIIVLVVVVVVLFSAALLLLIVRIPAPLVTPRLPAEWPLPLDSGLTYLPPVSGPTTPLQDDRGGGLWIINAAREGKIRMDFSQYSLDTSVSPFRAANLSVRLDTNVDFNVAPDPALVGPLEAVYYVVPGRNMSNALGPTDRNGAIAFFSGREFVVASPFTRTVYYHFALGFDPVWTGEDPVSAGQAAIAPAERCFVIGILCVYVGPYRYLYASDGTHTAVFEVSYVHEGDPTHAVSGRAMFFNESLTAPPFVYYNQERVTSDDIYRSGAGQAIVLPLQNGTLEVANVTGAPRAWLPLTLAGEPAVVSGSIGFVRATYPMRLHLPLRSASWSGIVALDLLNLSPVFEYLVGDPSLLPLGVPASFSGSFLPLAWFSPASRTTRLLALNETGEIIPQFAATVSGPVQTMFEVQQLSKLFIFTEAGSIVTMPTVFATGASLAPENFPLRPPSNASFVIYAGGPSGTIYGFALTAQELYGLWTDPTSAKTALFALLVPPS